jgi:hypothetical protein
VTSDCSNSDELIRTSITSCCRETWTDKYRKKRRNMFTLLTKISSALILKQRIVQIVLSNFAIPMSCRGNVWKCCQTRWDPWVGLVYFRRRSKPSELKYKMWQVDSLLSNDCEISYYTTAVTRRRPVNSNRRTVFYLLSVPRYQQDKLVECVKSWLVSEWVSEGTAGVQLLWVVAVRIS